MAIEDRLPSPERPITPIIGAWTPRRVEEKKITPNQCRRILEECNLHNRSFTPRIVERVRNANETGTWDLTNATIGFSDEGVLLDGQNRLKGGMLSGKPLHTFVSFGLKKTVFKSIDRGKNRDLSSDLQIAGEKDTKALAAALLVIKGYHDGIRSRLLLAQTSDADALLEFLDEHPGIREASAFAQRMRKRIPCPPRLVAMVYYISGYGAKAPIIAKRDDFFDRLCTGTNLTKEDPILVLREKFYAMRDNPDARVKSGMGRYSTMIYLQYLVRAWNFHVQGQKISKLASTYEDTARMIPGPIPNIRSAFRGKTMDDLDAERAAQGGNKEEFTDEDE